jgi:energy-coupling factor transporter transmembrane protein EcfT
LQQKLEDIMKLPTERKALFLFGTILIVSFSILVGLLHIGVVYLFGAPIVGLLLGILLIWFSRVSAEAKWLLTLIPFPIAAFTFFISLFLNYAEAERFIIPADYRGEIVVFYGEPCGEPAIFEDGERIYRISGEGVLITQHEENDGYLNRSFFLVDENGGTRSIPQFQNQNFNAESSERVGLEKYLPTVLTKETVGAFWAYGRETYHGSRNSIGYIVADYRYFDRDARVRSLEGKNFPDRAVKLLNDCRATMHNRKN